MHTTMTIIDLLARIGVSDDLHASIEHDEQGNPVVVIIAPLTLNLGSEE